MKLKYKLNWNLWDWAARRRLSASRRGKRVQEGGKSRPHAMPIYPLSPTARTNANSPHNRPCNTRSPHATRKQRLSCLLGSFCCRQSLLQSPSAHCTSILLLLHFPCSQHTCSAEITSWQKTLQRQGAYPYRLPCEHHAFLYYCSHNLSSLCRRPSTGRQHLIQKVCSQAG